MVIKCKKCFQEICEKVRQYSQKGFTLANLEAIFWQIFCIIFGKSSLQMIEAEWPEVQQPSLLVVA